MPRRPDPARPKGPAAANFKLYGVYWQNKPDVKTFARFGGASAARAYDGQKTKLFKTYEEARVFIAARALKGKFKGVMYERLRSGLLSRGRVIERYNDGQAWWEIDRG